MQPILSAIKQADPKRGIAFISDWVDWEFETTSVELIVPDSLPIDRMLTRCWGLYLWA